MKNLILFFICVAALCQAGPKIVNPQYKKVFVPEKNRIELLQPVKAGTMLLRPTFNSCSFYYGTGRVKNPVLQFRAAGKAWQKALEPVHFHEDKNSVSGSIVNEYRGSIVKLEENTAYEVRFCDGEKELARGSFKTWASEVPVARTIYIDADNFKAPFTISAQGTPDGWIRYTTKGGKPIVNRGKASAFRVKNARYVLLDDMVIDGGVNKREVITVSDSSNVRIRNCEIFNWGRVGIQRFDRQGKFYMPGSKRAINFDGAIRLRPGSSCITIERCYIHDPAGHANSWYYSHPAGPQAVTCEKPDHSVVIRYNDFVASDKRRFNDAVESAGNFHTDGGFRRDADIYGNFIIFCSDDSVEIDGGQMNVRCFNNRFESCYTGLSIQGCMASPVYVFENVFSGEGDEFDRSSMSIKIGGPRHGLDPYAFIFNNTMASIGRGVPVTHTLNSVIINNLMTRDASIPNAGNVTNCRYAANSIANGEYGRGYEQHDTKFVSPEKGNFIPLNALPAAAIDNFLPAGGIRGAFQKNSSSDITARPVPFDLDIRSISNIRVSGGKAVPSSVQFTCTTGGKDYCRKFAVRKNADMDWISVTPEKGVLKSGEKITFTVKFHPEKMKSLRLSRGAFIIRADNGFSRAVSVYAAGSYVQPFKCGNPEKRNFYIDAFKPERVCDARSGKELSPDVRVDPLGMNRKVLAASENRVYEYKVFIPEAGRYYFMLHSRASLAGKSFPKLFVSINNEKFANSTQQLTDDHMRWSMLTPGCTFGNQLLPFDLEPGTYSIKFYKRMGCDILFDGIAVTDDPKAFEPR